MPKAWTSSSVSPYWPTAIEAARYQGALYAIPFKLHPGPAALYYNVKHVGEAGVTMPEKQFASWDELIKAGKALTKDGRYGFQLNLTPGGAANNAQPVVMYLRSWGADVYSADGKKATLNDPKATYVSALGNNAFALNIHSIEYQQDHPTERTFFTEENITAGLAKLREEGFGHIVVHLDYYSRDVSRDNLVNFLTRHLGPPVASEGSFLAFSL